MSAERWLTAFMCRNTYALIPGHLSDEIVVIGNHNDACTCLFRLNRLVEPLKLILLLLCAPTGTFGAGDPNSGTAAVHEIVKGFGELKKQGWKPLRTILVASWDAEE